MFYNNSIFNCSDAKAKRYMRCNVGHAHTLERGAVIDILLTKYIKDTRLKSHVENGWRLVHAFADVEEYTFERRSYRFVGVVRVETVRSGPSHAFDFIGQLHWNRAENERKKYFIRGKSPMISVFVDDLIVEFVIHNKTAVKLYGDVALLSFGRDDRDEYIMFERCDLNK